MTCDSRHNQLYSTVAIPCSGRVFSQALSSFSVRRVKIMRQNAQHQNGQKFVYSLRGPDCKQNVIFVDQCSDNQCLLSQIRRKF